ncbi:Multifunctional cyclase-dehydratase-3-O-methyl transferase tcmN [Erwinia amylovora Ea644]|uniref:class I SAM-dependent methyltransferase n=1 Tax=Erwinia amylovora TaxID=552 RepID=UPI0002CBC4AA|nr:class I SAM-dependent methyltransferase [Erwinia amylovora]CCP04481.1 Multifunctional cyclase-dehydratase-3-O-methyl transferase tcmN [Erwinia amylovora Ea644]
MQSPNYKLMELENREVDKTWIEIERAGVIKSVSNYLLCQVIFACHQAGIAASLYQQEEINEEEIYKNRDSYLCKHLLNYLETHDLLTVKNNTIRVKKEAEGWFSPVAGAQLGFYLEAYGPVVREIPSLISGKSIYGTDVLRNGRALGIHCATLFQSYHTDTVLQALSDKSSSHILDLGCGAGQFLIDACLRDPSLTGVGLDISAPAIEEANELCIKYNLTNRLTFVVGDAFQPNSWSEECRKADVICAVGVIHEHFRDGEQAVINILNIYAKSMKNKCKRFILGEPEIRYDLEKNDCDLYLVHIFTAQGFPRYREEWMEIIEKTDFDCLGVYSRPHGGPRFNFFVLETPDI